MAGFDDLIPECMPYFMTEEIPGTAGTSWEWGYQVTDGTGAAIDLTSGFTATAAICPANSTTSVVAVSVTFPSVGALRCTVTATNSAAVTPGTYFHEVTITRTSDSKKIIIVGAGDAVFRVKRKAS